MRAVSARPGAGAYRVAPAGGAARAETAGVYETRLEATAIESIGEEGEPEIAEFRRVRRLRPGPSRLR